MSTPKWHADYIEADKQWIVYYGDELAFTVVEKTTFGKINFMLRQLNENGITL